MLTKPVNRLLKKITKGFFTIIVVLFCLFSYAQNNQSENDQIREIDSLGQIKKFEQADSIIKRVLSKSKDKKIINQVNFFKAKHLQDQNILDEATIILLDVLEDAEGLNQIEILYRSNLIMALINEKTGDLSECRKYLHQATKTVEKYNLYSLSAELFVRKSSYYRHIGDIDSALSNANKAVETSEKYNDHEQMIDGHLLMGILLEDSQSEQAIFHFNTAANEFYKQNDFEAAASMYANISSIYLDQNNTNESLKYINKVANLLTKKGIKLDSYFYKKKYEVFEALNQKDSTIFYLKLLYEATVEEDIANTNLKINEIEERFQNEKNSITIRRQKTINKQQGYLIILFGLLAATGAFLTYFKIKANKKLSKKNRTISSQAVELKNSLAQKELLLNEIHHRVKNNLQTIVGLLAIQADPNSNKRIEELTRESQDRINSMALLHDALYQNDDFELINMQNYFEQLTNYLLNSNNYKSKIELKIIANNVTLNLDRAVPIGLIMVELINNSIKHAFNNKNNGEIIIDMSKVDKSYYLLYKDNGVGFERMKRKGGLGMEIIEGLVSQIHGELERKTENGAVTKIKF